MPRLVPVLGVALTLSVATAADGQAPAPMPAHIIAAVGLPGAGPARFANATIDFSTAAWAVDGCVSASAGVCFATQHVVLTPAQRTELVRLWADVAAMPLCEPAAFAPGDPAFNLSTPSASYDGHLPAAAADLPARTTGVCAADARLAWWLAQRLGA